MGLFDDLPSAKRDAPESARDDSPAAKRAAAAATDAEEGILASLSVGDPVSRVVFAPETENTENAENAENANRVGEGLGYEAGKKGPSSERSARGGAARAEPARAARVDCGVDYHRE